MYIFFVDLAIDIDAIAPIVYKLNKEFPKKVFIYSTNFIQNNEDNKLIEDLKINGVKYHKLHSNKFVFNLINLTLKIFNLLPRKFLDKFRFLYSYIYRNILSFDEDDLLKIFEQNNTKVVTLDESFPLKKIEVIKRACNKLNIKLILKPTGVEIFDTSQIKPENDLKYCDYFLTNSFLRFNIINSTFKDKLINLGSARYSNEWLKKLDTLFPVKSEENKIKVGILLTQKTQNFPINCVEIKKLLEDKDLIVKFKNKPRDFMPNKCCDFFYDEMSTTGLINWSDLIIGVQASPLIEAIIKNKKILYLDYLVPKSLGIWNRKFKCVDIVESYHDLFEKINKIKNNDYFLDKENQKECIDTIVGVENETINILDNHAKFYKSIS